MTTRTGKLGVGLIVPSSNTVMEPDFHRCLGPRAVVSTTRIFLEEVTRAAETRMLKEDLPRAAKLMKTAAPDIVVFGCTSAGALGTLAHDDGIRDGLQRETGAQAVTVLGAVITQLHRVRPRRLALFTPYLEDLTHSVAHCLDQAGYPPIAAFGMEIRANLEIGKVTPKEIVRFVRSHLTGEAPDCICLSCTNWRALESIDRLQKQLGIPIISSNQAAIDLVRHLHANGRGAA